MHPAGPRVRSRSGVGALALGLVAMATLGGPRPARAIEPPSTTLPVFTCRIPHAAASSALGTFATSLTLWTGVTDASVEHVAAVLWLEPAIAGAVSAIDRTGRASGEADITGRR